MNLANFRTDRNGNPYGLKKCKYHCDYGDGEYCHYKEIDRCISNKTKEEIISDCFEPWDVLWEAPDGTFKGKCDNCGFVNVFIEGHVTQYKFCPQCGEQKQEL